MREQRSSTDRRNAPRATDTHRRAGDRIKRADLDSLATLRESWQMYQADRQERESANAGPIPANALGRSLYDGHIRSDN